MRLNPARSVLLKQLHIAVIGGGIAGLATSAILAAAGQRVTLLEQNEWLGGKSRRIELLGQRIDTGPSLVTFPAILDKVLQRYELLSGSQLAAEERIQLLRLPEVGRYFYRDRAVDLPVPAGHDWHPAWQRYTAARAPDELAIQQLLSSQIGSSKALLSALRLAIAWRGRINAAGYLNSLGWLPAELRAIIAIHSLNAGLPPTETLTLYASLPAVMANQGVMVPLGGVYEIPRLLGKLAERSGAEVRTGVRVSRIEAATDGSSGALVHIDSESESRSEKYDWVVLAADSPALDPERSNDDSRKLTCSGVAIFGVLKPNKKWSVVNHSVLLPDDPQSLDRSLTQGVWPEQTMSFVNYYPAGEIYPNERDVVAILLTAPANGAEVTIEHPLIQGELNRIQHQFGLKNPILDDLAAIRILDPQYFGSWGGHSGALYGEARGLMRSGPFHLPKRKSRSGWLWRVGSSVHPGGGIPAVLGGVLMTTEQMLAKLAKQA